MGCRPVSNKNRISGISGTELRDEAIRAVPPTSLISFRVDAEKFVVPM
jgi:hypothetical protein